MRRLRTCGLVLALGIVFAAPAAAQDTAGGESIRLFFDCQGMGCRDLDFFRREIPWVNWVRDRESADVHVLVTSQTTGGGGQAYRMRFIGRQAFAGVDEELVANSAGDATDDEVRRLLAARLRLGLGPYVAATPLADQMDLVRRAAPEGGAAEPGGSAVRTGDDPWDFWVFTLRGNTYLNGESSYHSANYNTSVSANRTTDAWKLTVSGRFSRNTQTFDVDDPTTAEVERVEYEREDWSTTGLAVKSLTPRWSLGTRVGVGRSTYLNEDFRWNVSPGIEFNVFPYSESSRRALTFQALVEARHWDYTTETIFSETAETRVAATLSSSLSFVQPWGRASIGANHSRYLHDASKWQSSVSGNFEVRVFKGFSVNMYGSYGWVRDQLYLEGGEGFTHEEILLRQRALATDFNYFTSFGISYRFGSIFNNVVNPRFGEGQMFFF